MKSIKYAFLMSVAVLSSCGEETGEDPAELQSEQKPVVEEAMLTQQQYNALDMKIDTLSTRLMQGFVEANGELEVPPQSEASVTPVIGGNVKKIQVIEGDQVRKGQVLAYLEHPDIIKIQTQYLNAVNELSYLQKDFSRQQKLYEAGVGSGETYQKTQSQLSNAKGSVAGLEAQLKQLNVQPEKVQEGLVQPEIPILSPIAGAVQAVKVNTGQFVQAQAPMFEIINTDHVHVDLRVFEKDVAKVKEGQKVYFTVESLPSRELTAEILSMSKNFEQDPKALHVHAEIKDRPSYLVPGMYVRARIAVSDQRQIALPEAAIAKDAGKFYVFTAEEEGEDWSFKPIEVIPGEPEGEWMAIQLLENVPPGTRFAYNNAYYLMAEMRKGEGGHSH